MYYRFPTISLIYDRYKKASSKRQASIEIRITFNRKQKYISTGIKLYPNQWKKDKVINTIDAPLINHTLETILLNVKEKLINMMKGDNFDIMSINLSTNPPLSFIQFCEQRSIVRKYGKTKDSQERYDRFLKSFKSWGKIRYFEDITEESIISFDEFLKDKGLRIYSKWNNYHRFLNSFIMDAIEAKHIAINPYKTLNIEKGYTSEGINKCLTPEEFTRLKQADLPTSSLERVRDLFIFQTYTCLSYRDMKNFSKESIKEIDGMDVYIGYREKTKKPFTVPLLAPAVEILEKYSYSLPIISNVKYNSYLKVIAQAAGIDKPISTHWARHTGATMLLNKGVDLKIIARICGHSSTRITEQIYAKLLDETVVSTIKKTSLPSQVRRKTTN